MKNYLYWVIGIIIGLFVFIYLWKVILGVVIVIGIIGYVVYKLIGRNRVRKFLNE